MTDEPDSTPSSLSGFGGLEGINEAKDVQASHTNVTLDKLLELEKRVVTDYKPGRGQHFDIYQKLYPQIKDELSVFPFTEDDLRSLIWATSNMDCNLTESQMRGMYTGMLLHLLTERNKAEGKRTRFYINGNGNRFDYLFLYAQFVDEVIMDNFVGNCIGHNLASNGNANKIIGMNLTGENALSWCGTKGVIDQIIGINITGINPIAIMSHTFSIITQTVAVNIESTGGDCSGKTSASYGQVICADIKGALSIIKLIKKFEGVNIYQLIGDNIQMGINTLNVRQIIFPYNSLYWLDHPLMMLFQRDKLRKTVDLARSLKDATYPAVLGITDELYALRPKVPDEFFSNSKIAIYNNAPRSQWAI